MISLNKNVKSAEYDNSLDKRVICAENKSLFNKKQLFAEKIIINKI